MAQAAERFAVQEAEQDRPGTAERHHPAYFTDGAVLGPVRSEPPSGGQQEGAVDDVADHDAEEDRQRQRHQPCGVQAAARRPGQEPDQLLEWLPAGPVPQQYRLVLGLCIGVQALDGDGRAEPVGQCLLDQCGPLGRDPEPEDERARGQVRLRGRHRPFGAGPQRGDGGVQRPRDGLDRGGQWA